MKKSQNCALRFIHFPFEINKIICKLNTEGKASGQMWQSMNVGAA